MNEAGSVTREEKPKGRWWRRILLGFGIFILLLLAFHRPLLHAVIRIAAVKVAAKQHIDLSLDVGGTILTSLSLENIHASPDGKGPSPVEKIDIELVRVNYDLIGFARGGLQNLLKSYELKNANLVVRPVAGTPSQKQDLGSTLSGIFQIPALYTDHIHVENLSLALEQAGGELALKGLTLTLDTDAPGVFKVERLQVPQFRTWENLAAETSYTNRDLIISHLNLDEDVQLDKIEMDASRRLEKINRLGLGAHLFGGVADFSLFLHEIGKNQAEMKVDTTVSNISTQKLGAYLHKESLPAAMFKSLTLSVEGDPNVPASLTGNVAAEIDDIIQGAIRVDSVKTSLVATESVLTVKSAEVRMGRDTVTLDARCDLPKKWDDPGAAALDGKLAVDAPDLSRFSPQVTAGAVSANGTFGLHDRKFSADITASGKGLAAAKAEVATLGVRAVVSKEMPAPSANPRAANQPAAPFFEGLRSEIEASTGEIRYPGYAIDSIAAKVTSKDEHVQLESAEIKRETSDILAHGSATLPADGKFATMPVQADFTLAIPNVAEFNAEPKTKGVNASVNGSGSVRSENGVYNGTLKLKAAKLAFEDFAADGVDIDAAVVDNVAEIKTFRLALNPTDQVSASGKAGIQQPFKYDGRLQMNIRNLAAFNSILKAGGVKEPIAGALNIAWQGSGEAGPQHHSGHGEVRLQGGEFGAVKPIEVEIAGDYTPEIINFPTVHLSTNQGDFKAGIDLKNSELRIHDILLQQGKTGLLSGSISVPLDLRTPKNVDSIIPQNGAVAVNLVSKDINIETLLKPPTGDAPAKGLITTTITASGSLDQLAAGVQVQGRGLQAKAAAKLAPATLDLTLALKSDRLTLNGTLRQPKISPLIVAGSLPFPVKKLLKDKKIDEQSPVQLSVKLEQSSVGFVSDLVPALRFVDGHMSIDAGVGGTLAHPTLTGAVLLDLPAIRFLEQNLPAISGFKGDIRLAGNRVTINRLGGDISGGPFNLAGTLQFAKLTEPLQAVANLKVTTASALLLRNDTITMRADTDISITGPLAKAHVAGTVGITKSKFFREIDILPLQLPGRPAPKPPAAPTTVSFPTPPLRDWTFDIAIKSKDPFLIRGNLANGAASIDLKLGGSGLQPTLTGSVRIDNFVASLPFSKLNITSGYVYFSEDNPFVPTLDIQGTSEMRDYNINVYISGSASNPQTVLSSEPPLPQEDIVSLLATGATTQELTGSGGGDVLAGRAAALLFQKLYRKVFKKKDASENESLSDRIQVDAGGVDPRTGKQELTTTLKLNDQFQLVGGLDVQGYLRGEVRYLIRFR